MLLLNFSSIEAHEKTGKVQILAAAGDKRAQARPELPTIAEAGVPGFSTTVWFALFGPANMPAELVQKIHADVSKVLDLPQSKEFFEKNSFERVTDSPAEFAKLVDHDSQHWDTLIKQVGAKVDRDSSRCAHLPSLRLIGDSRVADERLCNPISTAELERRWKAVRAAMPEQKLDALIVQGANNLAGTGGYFRWFTGVSMGTSYPATVIFPKDG